MILCQQSGSHQTGISHFNHDKEFIWKARGFSSIQEMNEKIIQSHNNLIKPEDTLYILGDVMLGPDDQKGLDLINSVNGKKIIIAGNHDTKRRRAAYQEVLNIPVYDALYIKCNKYNFYLSHFPTLTANFGNKGLKESILNLFGHTHQNNNFYQEMPFMYHVGVDSHNCCPINVEEIICDMKEKVKDCQAQL